MTIKKNRVEDASGRFKVSQADKSTELYRDLMDYTKHRQETIKELLTTEKDNDKREALQGNYAELKNLMRDLNYKRLPTNKGELLRSNIAAAQALLNGE